MRISDWSSDVCSSDLLGKVVAALAIVIAELALDRLQLFVEIIFALTFFHLALHAAANLLFDLQHTKLALHESEDHFEPLRRRILDEQSLLVRDLDVEIARDRIGEARSVLDLGSEERRVGKEGGGTGSSRWWREHYKKNHNTQILPNR